ncbi:Alkaline phosphatase [hydrothermal vent metagenome]|uniref:Alkaline phosphatase n=1 Tax=hydrothermal vent metagenome TaxID=652676 RepID=A0A3B0XHR4_9ZZZZ
MSGLFGSVGYARESPAQWYKDGEIAIKLALSRVPNTQHAKNIILFVGDGMSISTVTAARILEGQQRGEPGEENKLSFETMPYVALSKTYNTNQQTPDSAGTMTAMMTGVKTKDGVISVNQNVIKGDCASSKGNELITFLEQAEIAGQSTGVVSTTGLTHATPAATYAHVADRKWENDHRLTPEAVKQGCKDIARQLIEFPYGNGLEVAMGGGRANFWPNNRADLEEPNKVGARKDGRNLTEEWVRKNNNSQFIWKQSQFDNIDISTTNHLLALFDYSHMTYEVNRKTDLAGEPSLAQMTSKAIELLSKNDKGYFLMVEGGRIDHGHHANNAHRALTETIAFSNAIKMAMQKTNSEDTLIIVTADHSHVFTLGGYPTRGNPILGKVIGNDRHGNPKKSLSIAKDGLPYTTINYVNGRVYKKIFSRARRADLTSVDTEKKNYYQESLIEMYSESHSAEDVAIYANGPYAHLIHGVQEQNYIYHVMRYASKILHEKN